MNVIHGRPSHVTVPFLPTFLRLVALNRPGIWMFAARLRQSGISNIPGVLLQMHFISPASSYPIKNELLLH